MNQSVASGRSGSAPVPYRTPDATLLGTAAWLTSSGEVLRPFREGDLFLGNLPSGGEMGFRDDRHALVAAGTRSGKGVSLVIPNLVSWPGSIVVIDPKGENAKVTARRRSTGSRYCVGRKQKTWILDPFGEVQTASDDFADLKGAFNPLDMIRPDKDESVDIAARIAESLIVSENSSDPIWESSGKDALKGVILHVASAPHFTREQRNLVTVQSLLRSGDQRARTAAALVGDESSSAMVALFEAMARNPAFSGVVAGIGAQLRELAESPRTLAGVLQVVRVNLNFMDSPGMKRCLSVSSFALSELKTRPGGLSLYLSLPQRFMETHYRWLRLMTELIIGEMEQVRGRPVTGHPVLMVLDEFPALRRMRALENAAAQIAGYGVKLLFVVQTLAQLKDIYKDNWETFISNAGVKLFFCNDDHFTRKYVSDLIGEAEVMRTARTLSHTAGTSWGASHSNNAGLSNGSSGLARNESSGTSFSDTSGESASDSHGHSESVHKRALVTPDEVGRMFGDRDRPTALALISGYQPLFLTRAPYFKGLRWAGAYDAHPDHPSPPTPEQVQQKRAEEKQQHERALADAEAARRAREQEQAREAAVRERARAIREQQEMEEQERRRRQDRGNDLFWNAASAVAWALLGLTVLSWLT